MNNRHVYLLVELYQLQLSFKLILRKRSTFLAPFTYYMVRPNLVNAHFVHPHTQRKGVSVSSCVINVLLEQSHGYLHHVDWVIMFCRILFRAQNTAEIGAAVLTFACTCFVR